MAMVRIEPVAALPTHFLAHLFVELGPSSPLSQMFTRIYMVLTHMRKKRMFACRQDKDFRRRLNKRSAMEEIEAGGDSFFRAVADQLYGDQNVHSWIRYIVHVYMVRVRRSNFCDGLSFVLSQSVNAVCALFVTSQHVLVGVAPFWVDFETT